MKRIVYLLLLLFFQTQIFPQYPSQKYAVRGIWITTVGHYDWPSVPGTTLEDIARQKSELITILDAHKKIGINAIYFNMRVHCDAFYKSKIEPWAKDLTGKQGAAPADTNYDPLQFAVNECHKRGMELHAWINPYRAHGGTNFSLSNIADNHVIKAHPEWIIKCSSSEYRFLDPGLPQVREYLIKVIMDFTRRYDIDGVHMDDFFYAYTGTYGTYNDDASFNKYKGSFTERGLWRRNNVNLLLQMINDSLKTVKPWVKLGISPAGNPTVNDGIYVDAFGWLKGNYVDTTGVSHTGTAYIDYIMPQLYWVEYLGLLPEWANASTLNGRHCIVGEPAYRYTESNFTPNELAWEIKTNRSNPYVSGEVYFRSAHLYPLNLAGCADSLMHNYYVYPAITPKMAWLPGSSTKPNAPSNLRIEMNSVSQKYELKWDKPAKASDGDTAFYYVIYRFDKIPTALELDNPSKMLGTTGQTVFSTSEGNYSVTKGQYYAVTAIDRYSNESSMSNVYYFNVSDEIPDKPVLTGPANADENQPPRTILKWNPASKAVSYQLQVSDDSAFTNILNNLWEIKSTSVYYNLLPAKTYYWRIRAYGLSGAGQFSEAFSMKSGVPLAPIILEPKHMETNVYLNPTLKWSKAFKASSYRIQVATSALMTSGIIVDTIVTDTSLTLKGLAANKIYNWHVLSYNTLGQSDWTSPTNGFRTGTSTGLDNEDSRLLSYSLEQNYPNPFNPATKISYSIINGGHVKLSVFNILGQEVAVLVDGYQGAGIHSVEFSLNSLGHNLTSGIYLYALKTGEYVSTKKMTLMK